MTKTDKELFVEWIEDIFLNLADKLELMAYDIQAGVIQRRSDRSFKLQAKERKESEDNK